jgi:hypothetical protein
MCTVTFIPVNNKFFLTSNRDEKAKRKSAYPPAIYWGKGSGLLYPKDATAGGSWITLNGNGNAAVLLNGAFSKHIQQDAYRQSRGLILIEIIGAERPSIHFNRINLVAIEPFTIILFEAGCLYECRWDGHKKYCKQLRSSRPYIWSSSTLYDIDTVKKREYWFAKWLTKNSNPTLEDILNFHRFTGDGDLQNDLNMNRDGELNTVSITCIELDSYAGRMKYIDLKNYESYLQQFSFGPLKHVA